MENFKNTFYNNNMLYVSLDVVIQNFKNTLQKQYEPPLKRS